MVSSSVASKVGWKDALCPVVWDFWMVSNQVVCSVPQWAEK